MTAREKLKARLDRPLIWLDFLIGFLLGILLTIIVGAVTKSDAASAASGIVCSVKSVAPVQRTLTITIKSSKTIYYGQTSARVSYFDRNHIQRWITRDEGYGATIRVVKPAGSREWGAVQTWHAGTPCRAYAISGPAGAVNV